MPEVDLCSPGFLSQQLQLPPSRILKILARMGVKPSKNIDGIPHFNEEAVDRLYAELRLAQTPGPSIAEM